jgi:hypothetical protein
MIKNLKILLPILLLSSTTFSQKDNSKICFDYKTAQKIALDIVKGDAAIEELGKTQKLVTQLNEKIVEKDSIISDYKVKDSVCVEQNKTHYNIQLKQTNIITGLEKDVTTLTTQNNNLKKGLKWLGGGFLGSLTALLILLSIK